MFLVLGEGLSGGVMRGEFSIEKFVMGEENFHEWGAGFFSILLKEQ